jgi:hypothetical protein
MPDKAGVPEQRALVLAFFGSSVLAPRLECQNESTFNRG